MLVIDDNSPDGTGEIADRLAEELERVSVLHRERKEGLGPAYLAGFDARSPTEPTCARDGLRLLSRSGRRPATDRRGREDADLVLGSRYVEGGGTANWGLLRRFVSRGGSLYAQILLGLRVRDLTGGFKCYRRAVLEALPLDEIHSKGYAFQIE